MPIETLFIDTRVHSAFARRGYAQHLLELLPSARFGSIDEITVEQRTAGGLIWTVGAKASESLPLINAREVLAGIARSPDFDDPELLWQMAAGLGLYDPEWGREDFDADVRNSPIVIDRGYVTEATALSRERSRPAEPVAARAYRAPSTLSAVRALLPHPGEQVISPLVAQIALADLVHTLRSGWQKAVRLGNSTEAAAKAIGLDKEVLINAEDPRLIFTDKRPPTVRELATFARNTGYAPFRDELVDLRKAANRRLSPVAATVHERELLIDLSLLLGANDIRIASTAQLPGFLLTPPLVIAVEKRNFVDDPRALRRVSACYEATRDTLMARVPHDLSMRIVVNEQALLGLVDPFGKVTPAQVAQQFQMLIDLAGEDGPLRVESISPALRSSTRQQIFARSDYPDVSCLIRPTGRVSLRWFDDTDPALVRNAGAEVDAVWTSLSEEGSIAMLERCRDKAVQLQEQYVANPRPEPAALSGLEL